RRLAGASSSLVSRPVSGRLFSCRTEADMTNQLLGWLVLMGLVLSAATYFFNRLSGCLNAMTRSVESLTGFVVSVRAFWVALHPVKKPQPRPRRPRTNNQT